jgi:hypothetical protein
MKISHNHFLLLSEGKINFSENKRQGPSSRSDVVTIVYNSAACAVKRVQLLTAGTAVLAGFDEIIAESIEYLDCT